MMNNPFEIMRATRNPEILINSILQGPANTDPRIKKVADLYRNHDSQGLKDMAENLCREYGTTPEQEKQRLGGFLGL